MFNLKKQSQIVTTEKMLDKRDIELGQETVKPVITDKLLRDNRKNNDGNQVVEKRLPRTGQDDVVTEKQMNVAENPINKMRRDDGVVLMDMATADRILDNIPQPNYQSAHEDFKKQDKSRYGDDREFWDAYVEISDKKIVGNVQSSQLLSNYKTREDFEKANPMAGKKAKVSKKSQEALFDADAMLYHIFRQAAGEERELTEKEEQLVADINANKIKVMAQDEDYWRIFTGSDEPELTGDRLDDEAGAEEDIITDTVDVYARYVSDGYLVAATTREETQGDPLSDSFWDHSVREEGAKTVVLSNVPSDVAKKLCKQGTTEQYYSDGYEAAQAAIPYLPKEDEVKDITSVPTAIADTTNPGMVAETDNGINFE